MEYKPNAYERDVLDTFKKVVEKTGYLKEFYFYAHDYGCGGMSIVKQFGKWTSYVYEKGSKIGQRWYDDVYDLVVDAFETLSKSATDYCKDNFPSKMYFEIREDVRVNKKYKLYGTMNMLDIVPGAVYPVFEDEDHVLYFGDAQTDCQTLTRYTDFIPIKEDALKLVRPLSESDNVLVGVQDYYKITHSALCATEFAKDKVFIGDVLHYLEFIKSFETDDEEYAKELEKEAKELDWVINGQWDENDYFSNEAEFTDHLRLQKGIAK